MYEDKSKVYIIVPIIVVLVIAGYYFFGWDIGAKLNKDSTAYDIVELSGLINRQISAGEKGGTFYLSGISEEEIININDYICSINGVVEGYSILEERNDHKKVKFTYEISDNYYVLEKHLNGTEIPADRPKAHRLYARTQEILGAIIRDDMTDYEKELAIHDYIVANCSYGQEEDSQEYAFRAYGVLVQGKAVCNGYAEAMSLLLSCVGVENEIMTGEADGELHAWNRVLLDGEWYQVDATWDDPVPDRVSFVGHMYFNITDNEMDDSHIWNEDLYVECEADKYNYFNYNKRVYQYSQLEELVRAESIKNITGIIEVKITDYSKSTYTFDFINNIQGIQRINWSVEELGNYDVLTIYLNQ